MTLLQILVHTPLWVWGLLAALLALGWSQTRTRELGLARLTLLPLVMLALSFAGVATTFTHAAPSLLAWAAGVAAAVAVGRRVLPVRGASWSDAKAVLHVPGSWLPMALIVALFLIKYGVGVTLATEPTLAADTAFGMECGLAYGVFSGLFAARALALRAVAAAPRATPAAA